ncbi:alkaline phosphatase-like protein [Violaceomyces palustris]|uniref:Alkaline phosphatase-like protein n=1 Tax=Violaceomyces palustris TaxID=1673888 RepID=A0ACD0NVY3_9BASI|nr:alkaline phosphatase-like protein [Violaceomyces palustris]
MPDDAARDGKETPRSNPVTSTTAAASITSTSPSHKWARPPARFLVLSLLFHLVYISSVFDIYFTSPVVHPVPRFTLNHTYADPSLSQPFPTAQRLVLIVADGLRADTLFKHHPVSHLPQWAVNDLLNSASQPQSLPNHLSPFPQALSYQKDNQLPLPPSVPEQQTHAFAAPFLRQVATSNGVWGVSHTRVPTESRPGHVAMIAGMYEDVSAVTKGWKLNPIAFDSLLNQSSHSFAFGSPDIVTMFARGAAEDHVDLWTYDEKEEDFTKDATHLDLWVLDRFRDLLSAAKHDPELDTKIRGPGTVFFLHLLGLDTTGHTYRPFSKEYIGNTIVADAIARKVESLIDDFFAGDGKTAYVFTADHGMSSKGNHGDGHPDNTRTPIVAWGAGVRGPRTPALVETTKRETETSRDSYFSGWEMDHVSRQDLDQADITPLMATLVGVPMPANSEGRLRPGILDLTAEHKARAMFVNALQVLEIYRVKHFQRKERMLRFVPFEDLVPSRAVRKQDDHGEREPGSDLVDEIRESIEEEDWDDAILRCEDLIEKALQGARYLQTYDWFLLCSIVTLGYIGSILYGISFILRSYVLPYEILTKLSEPRPLTGLGKALVAPILGVAFAKFAAEDSPVTYYLYTAFAAFFWGRVIDERNLFISAWKTARAGGSNSSLARSVAIRIALAVLGLELIVMGYHQRICWFIGFLLIGLAWPAIFLDADTKARTELITVIWGLICIVCGLLTLTDLDKEESVPILSLSGLAFTLAGLVVIRFPTSFLSPPPSVGGSANGDLHLRHTLRTLKIQLTVIVLSTAITASSSYSLQRKQGLPLVNQISAWLVLGFSLLFPFLYGFKPAIRAVGGGSKVRVQQPHSQRLAIVVFALAPIFILLSIRDEAMFFGCYTLMLLIWSKYEGTLFEERRRSRNLVEPNGKILSKRKLEKEDFRMAIFFLFFLHVGFFGTGNIASISSFYLSPVYRLVPIFSPFLMATLLLVKILTPFLVLNSVFQALCASEPISSLQRSPPTRLDLIDIPLLGPTSAGGLGLQDAYAPVFVACIATDVLALNFLFSVKDQGSWLEIGQTITHFVMANLLQVFMLSFAALSSCIIGKV